MPFCSNGDNVYFKGFAKGHYSVHCITDLTYLISLILARVIKDSLRCIFMDFSHIKHEKEHWNC